MRIAKLSFACVVVVARAAVFGASLLLASEAAAEAPVGEGGAAAFTALSGGGQS